MIRVHSTAKVKTGKHAGLAGTVTDTKTDSAGREWARLHIEGVQRGIAFTLRAWFQFGQLEQLA